jgi:hypothetical protein
MISPTGSWKIRKDGWGDGKYNASRINADGLHYAHKGTDLVCDEGQVLVASADVTFKREALPYLNDSRYSGGIFENEWLEYKMLYFDPSLSVGQKVKQGQIVGYAQDISLRYPENDKNGKMVPHVHFEVIKINPFMLSKEVPTWVGI